MDGVIVVDKAAGWTSHDVVSKLRRIADTRRAGHLGTLDPAATGVLPVVIGKATRLSQFYTRSDKIYQGTVRFGWATTTYDREGEIVGEQRHVTLDGAEIGRALDTFRGEIWQTPPPVSAKRVDGKRAYELARKNIAVELAPVKVAIHELELLALEDSAVKLRVHCSGGTYMRSLAHDLGKLIGCGAFLEDLRRLASGEFEIAQARTIDQLLALRADDRLIDALVPARDMLPGFPGVYVDEGTVREIRNGRDFAASPFRAHPEARLVKAITREGELVAIGEAVLPNLYHPLVVL